MDNKPPQITLTLAAKRELALLYQMERLAQSEKIFRIQIIGKECEGFTYGTSFSEAKPNDSIITIKCESSLLPIHIDPFCAFYLQESTLDYARDEDTLEEGFIVINHFQSQFRKKFWTQHSELIPQNEINSLP